MKTLRYILLLGLWATCAHGAPAETPPPAQTPAAEMPAAAADPEQDTVALLRASPAAADAQELTVDGKPVLALLRDETLGQPQGGVLLLHDTGAHADWPGVIGTLRQTLPQYGWTTLSLQLPPPEAAATAEQTPARVRAALTLLAGKNIRNIILLGHGSGALAALRYAADNHGAVNGLILVAMGPVDDAALLNSANVPIYDIYGSAESLEVLRAGTLRLQEGRRMVRQDGAELPRYRQFVVEGADHFFGEQTDILQRRVRGWLKTHAGGMEITQ
jgi:hypothetical protein